MENFLNYLLLITNYSILYTFPNFSFGLYRTLAQAAVIFVSLKNNRDIWIP